MRRGIDIIFVGRISANAYSFTLYEKVKRVTIALKNKDYYPILMVSFDIPANHEHIVMNKILQLSVESAYRNSKINQLFFIVNLGIIATIGSWPCNLHLRITLRAFCRKFVIF